MSEKEINEIVEEHYGFTVEEIDNMVGTLSLRVSQLEYNNKDLKERIDNATERLNTLIEFWKKYNPIDNTMQVEQFKGVINILGGKE